MAQFNLFPAGYETQTVTAAEIPSGTVGYRNGVAFDYNTGDFVRDGQNRILDSDGIESWESWCINCLLTQRNMHLAYNSDFGIDVQSAMQAPTHQEAESILTREIAEAIMADPYGRTEYIEDLNFTWTAPNAVLVNLTIHGITDVTIDVTAYLTTGEG
jgi:hypothetical protein